VKAGRYDHITDAELLNYYTSDSNSEWMGILLERYTLLLLGVGMKYLKNEEEAKDCVQQIFLKVLNEAGKYKIDYFKSWLYMVAKNHCLMRLRDVQGRNIKEINEQVYIAAEDVDISELIQNEKTYSLLEDAMDELNEEQKLCVTLFYLQKKSYQQIAGLTSYNLLQVKSYIQNGKRNLKLLLEKKMKENGLFKK
jgi:RNA polymerase sigma-70 factor (ECF subfamily)